MLSQEPPQQEVQGLLGGTSASAGPCPVACAATPAVTYAPCCHTHSAEAGTCAALVVPNCLYLATAMPRVHPWADDMLHSALCSVVRSGAAFLLQPPPTSAHCPTVAVCHSPQPALGAPRAPLLITLIMLPQAKPQTPKVLSGKGRRRTRRSAEEQPAFVPSPLLMEVRAVA